MVLSSVPASRFLPWCLSMNCDLGYINQINPFSPSCLCSWSLCQQQKTSEHGGMHVRVRRLEINLDVALWGLSALSCHWSGTHPPISSSVPGLQAHTHSLLFIWVHGIECKSPCLQAKGFTDQATSVQLDYGQLVTQGQRWEKQWHKPVYMWTPLPPMRICGFVIFSVLVFTRDNW